MNSDKELFVCFKQDYSYRGLDSNCCVVVKAGDLNEVIEMDKNGVDIKEKCKELFGESTFRWSVMELVCDQPDTIKYVLEKGEVIGGCGEIGYWAVSPNSKKEARNEVKRMYVENEFDMDEDEE